MPKIKDIIALFKVRLSLTVVISSALGYGIAIVHSGAELNWVEFFMLLIGGALVTFSANAFNQILEKEQDTIMSRTQNRPLVTEKISLSTAFFVAVAVGLLGFSCMYWGTKPIAAVYSLLSLVLYSFVYTPSKKVTSFCVLIGAIPGAFPPLIGYLAATGSLDTLGLYLFSFQFIWQFPHFWAIAWFLEEDYKKVNYHMLPSKTGKSKVSAWIILIYTIICVILGMLPYIAGLTNIFGLMIICGLGLFFISRAAVLMKTLSAKDGKQLMFASLLFMPTVYMTILLLLP